uniref:collagen-flanked surface repeat-containing protein n=1 Tax=Granulicatella elegans TaxID=137732 RepID=UPI003898D92C
MEEKKEVTETPTTTGSTREAKVETVAATPKEEKAAVVTTTTPETREASTREAVTTESGQSGFRAARRPGPSRPAPSQPVNHSAATPTNTVAASAGTINHDKNERLRLEDAIEPTDVSKGTHKFIGEGTARLNTPIHYNVTTTRTNGGLDVSINYTAPGNTREFVRNNFILHTGNGFGTPQLRGVSGTTGNPSIVKGENFMSHSGYTLASSVDTNRDQTVRFFLPISRPNADLTFKLQPTTFNVNQGGGSEATINDPYSNSNYYFKERPLYLDANPGGNAAGTKTFKEIIDFQTIYLPTTKLAEGETKVVKDGVNGERQKTYKVHKFGEETVLGLPISNSITKEAKPRIVQIGVAKDLVEKPEVVKPRVDQNKVGDTNHLTFYLDKDGNNIYNEGVDELIQNIDIKDGAKGEKGDRGQQGERGLTGAQGAKGEKGDRGERGLTGAQGAKGEKGDQGERGLTGAQGAKGEKGDQGERGLTGAQGAKGEKGDRGERGLTGAQGAKGEKGDQGERGQDGKSLVAVKNGNKTKLYVENPAQPGQPLDPTHPLATITDGVNGRDGQSPTITATRTVQNGKNGVLITVTPVNGTPQSTFVQDGVNGQNGSTPTVTITEGKNGTHTLTVHTPGQADVSTVIRDGAQGRQGERGEKGDKGEAGRDGVTPTVTVKDNKSDGTHTITINDGRGNITNTIVKDGFDGKSPLVATNRNEEAKTTTVVFYYDENGNNELDASDKKLKEVVIADGAKGEKGDKGATPKVTTARGKDGRSTDITFTVPGEEPVTVNVKDGKDGRTPTIDLNALAEAAIRINNQRSGRVRRALADAPSTAPASQPVDGTRITAYFDNNGNGKYDPDVDELIGTSDILNGTNGRNGADGASGTDGRNGAELLSGPNAPTAKDGRDGDTYIDATTGDVYKKEGENWKKIGNIRGPQGLKGDKGQDGAQGPQGLKGDKGEQGLQGERGQDGAQGLPGRDGRDGAAGRDGRDGRDGKDVLNGKVDPTTEGKDGDKYVNTESGDVFVKNNGTWEKEGNIKGPKGDKGEQGL